MRNVNHWSDGEEGAQDQHQQNRCREIFTMVDRDKSGFVDEKGDFVIINDYVLDQLLRAGVRDAVPGHATDPPACPQAAAGV